MHSATASRKSTNGRFYGTPWSLRVAMASAALIAPSFAARIAARLFCTPIASRRSRQALPPGERIALDIGTRKIAVYCWGEPEHQPLALCAHGWSGSGSQFGALVPALREAGYAVVAFDQPAHGASSGRTSTLIEFAQVLTAVARYFRGERPVEVVLAHSLGATAASFAMSRGLVVQRAVMIAPVADPVSASRRFAQAVWLPECLRERMQALLEDQTGIAFGAFRARRVVRALGTPALLVHDLHDREAPWHEGHEYAHYWPQARLLSTQGLGHTRLLKEPAVIAAVIGFLAGGIVGETALGTYNLEPLF